MRSGKGRLVQSTPQYRVPPALGAVRLCVFQKVSNLILLDNLLLPGEKDDLTEISTFLVETESSGIVRPFNDMLSLLGAEWMNREPPEIRNQSLVRRAIEQTILLGRRNFRLTSRALLHSVPKDGGSELASAEERNVIQRTKVDGVIGLGHPDNSYASHDWERPFLYPHQGWTDTELCHFIPPSPEDNNNEHVPAMVHVSSTSSHTQRSRPPRLIRGAGQLKRQTPHQNGRRCSTAISMPPTWPTAKQLASPNEINKRRRLSAPNQAQIELSATVTHGEVASESSRELELAIPLGCEEENQNRSAQQIDSTLTYVDSTRAAYSSDSMDDLATQKSSGRIVVELSDVKPLQSTRNAALSTPHRGATSLYEMRRRASGDDGKSESSSRLPNVIRRRTLSSARKRVACGSSNCDPTERPNNRIFTLPLRINGEVLVDPGHWRGTSRFSSTNHKSRGYNGSDSITLPCDREHAFIKRASRFPGRLSGNNLLSRRRSESERAPFRLMSSRDGRDQMSQSSPQAMPILRLLNEKDLTRILWISPNPSDACTDEQAVADAFNLNKPRKNPSKKSDFKRNTVHMLPPRAGVPSLPPSNGELARGNSHERRLLSKASTRLFEDRKLPLLHNMNLEDENTCSPSAHVESAGRGLSRRVADEQTWDHAPAIDVHPLTPPRFEQPLRPVESEAVTNQQELTLSRQRKAVPRLREQPRARRQSVGGKSENRGRRTDVIRQVAMSQSSLHSSANALLTKVNGSSIDDENKKQSVTQEYQDDVSSDEEEYVMTIPAGYTPPRQSSPPHRPQAVPMSNKGKFRKQYSASDSDIQVFSATTSNESTMPHPLETLELVTHNPHDIDVESGAPPFNFFSGKSAFSPKANCSSKETFATSALKSRFADCDGSCSVSPIDCCTGGAEAV